MRVSFVCVSVLAAAVVCADEREDRANIECVIGRLNDDSTSSAQKRELLFTAGAENDLGRLSKLDCRLLRKSEVLWPEVTSPHIVIRSIRFITPRVALVDAANTQYGSVVLVRRVPLLLVMKKEKEWRIASLRVLVDPMNLP
jgi:hypothetical protein